MRYGGRIAFGQFDAYILYSDVAQWKLHVYSLPSMRVH